MNNLTKITAMSFLASLLFGCEGDTTKDKQDDTNSRINAILFEIPNQSIYKACITGVREDCRDGL